MVALKVFTFLLLSSIGVASAYPAAMEQMMSSEHQKRYGASSNDHEQSRVVEISLPLKIRTREDFIAWITYAMKMMASRINITLATGDNDSNMNLSTVPIVESTTEPEVVSRSPPTMRNSEHTASANPQMQRGENPPLASGVMANFENFFKSMFGIAEPNSFPKTNPDDFRGGNPFVKLFSEVTVNNPYEESENKAYREPEVFSPFSSPGIYLPIPLKPSGFIDDQLLSTYYNMIGHNSSDKPSTTSIKLVPMDTKKVENSNKLPSAPVKTVEMKGKDDGSSPVTPILSVPFEAFITIARDTIQNPASSDSIKMNKDTMLMMTRKPSAETSSVDSSETQSSGGVQVVFEDETPNVENNKKTEKKKEKSRKRQTSALQSLLRMLTLRGKKNATTVDIGTPSVLNVFQAVSGKLPGAKFDQFPVPNRGKRNETSQKQELDLDDFDDDKPSTGGFDDDDEEEMGSLGSITDLLPLVIPVLEDLSDPDSDVDLLELLMAGIPLLEGLSDENDPDAIDIVGTLGPILLKISAGPEGAGSDSGAILSPLIGLVAPVIGPLSGPLIGPLFRSSSGPDRAVDLTSLLQGVLGPLSQPGQDGMSPISTLTSNIVASLLQTLSKPGSGIDIGSLVSAVLSGASAGTSAGLSGGSKQKLKDPVGYYTDINAAVANAPKRPRDPIAFPAQPSHVARPPQGHYVNYPKQPMAYYNIYGYPAPIPVQQVIHADPEGLSTTYGGYGPVPAYGVNPKELIGQSLKDIFGAASGLIGAIVNTSAGLSGASSSKTDPVYGPPAYGPPAYGPPPPPRPPAYGPPPPPPRPPAPGSYTKT